MDFFAELGPLALGSRLRRLTDRVAQDVVNIYKEQHISFEPRWFPVYYLLSRKSPLSIVEIANILDISHPAVNQIAAELVREGFVESLKDDTDKRKRLLMLTDKGKGMLPVLQEIWDGVHMAVQDWLHDTGVDVMDTVEKMESALGDRSLHSRYKEYSKDRQMDAVEIIEYRPEYRAAFKELNLEWIARYFRVEPEDERVLENPETEILAKGGVILFALGQPENNETGAPENNQPSFSENTLEESPDSPGSTAKHGNGELPSPVHVLGTCALINKGQGVYELSKMAVTERARGRQIGKKLLAASIEKARALKASELMLETNSRLTPAVNLYRKLGFMLVPFQDKSKYERADMRMRLEL